MKLIHALVVLSVAGLAGCAGSVSAPEAVHSLSAEQMSGLHLSNISADAAQGVEMGDTDFDTICQKVKGYVQAQSPGMMVSDSTSAGAYKMTIHFTRFDRGSAFARAMLIGLGQIRIEATVDLMDASGASPAQYKVAKDFAIGGVVGATTSVEDVEDGFAKSVAEIVKAKTGKTSA